LLLRLCFTYTICIGTTICIYKKAKRIAIDKVLPPFVKDTITNGKKNVAYPFIKGLLGMNRRKFLAATGITTFLGKSILANAIQPINKPLVISTWEAGIKANIAAWKILQQKGTALDAVEAGVKVTEAEINCCVGLGANPDRDGFVTLDAAIMDSKGNYGAVAFLEDIQHPISVARMVMEKTPHTFLVGEGAKQFALANGFTAQPKQLSEAAQKAYKKWKEKQQYTPQINRENIENDGRNNHDTISMIALDANNNLSASCTTSGQGFKMRGRVGDAPIIGGGLYVDNAIGACAATGQGEDIVRIVGSHTVVEYMRHGYTPTLACKATLQRLVQLKGAAYCKNIQACFIAVNKKGVVGAYALHKGFNYAVKNASSNTLYNAGYLL
jgi:N4-(beta-N-acetylglucosaminyl)-L-asparaginase